MLARIALLAVCIGCSGGSSGPDEPSPFPGTWRVSEFDGMPQSGAVIWTFGEEEVAVNSGSFSGMYTFDPGADPKRIELEVTNATPNPNAGIYRFDSAARFTLKLQDGASARAATFDVETGYDVLVMEKL